MKNYKLTNRDIAIQFPNSRFHTMINDFTGAFACWVIKQDESRSYNLSIKAIEAYSNWLEKTKFTKKDMVIEMSVNEIESLTSEKLFSDIPEILAMNQLGKGFIDLGALSRNVYFHILREHITQPL